jgi:hypothetical protein
MQFYREGLGWPLSSASQGDVHFPSGGVVLALYPRDKLAEMPRSARLAAFQGLRWPDKSQEEVDQCCKRWSQALRSLSKLKLFSGGTAVIS